MTAGSKVDLDALTPSIIGIFPVLNPLEQRLSLGLYRLLAEGQPVPRATLAKQVGISLETTNQIIDGWPGVFSDEQRRVVSYWGLAIPAAFTSPHRLRINGRSLSAWCAWDTLFLPQLLGEAVEIESTSPSSSAPVHLTVTPDSVNNFDPAGAQMSFLAPDTAAKKDVVNTFCCFVHFFPSRQAGEDWSARRPGTFLLTIEEAFALGRRKNEAQYPEVLA